MKTAICNIDSRQYQGTIALLKSLRSIVKIGSLLVGVETETEEGSQSSWSGLGKQIPLKRNNLVLVCYD